MFMAAIDSTSRVWRVSIGPIVGTIMGLIQWFQMLAGATLKNPPATESKAVMALLCLIYVALCVRSFIAARKARLV